MNHFTYFCLYYDAIYLLTYFQCWRTAHKTPQYEIYNDKVVQGKDTAFVKSGQHIVSNYISPASQTYSNFIKYKFSINETGQRTLLVKTIG